ncbi:hypothetical protein [Scytonema sp. PCC 10023]|uniref:hypothetical protein n=1 Tax=Scytonema sp. PCC 10023 TaxID=1680591 RepID=UPI0039C60577
MTHFSRLWVKRRSPCYRAGKMPTPQEIGRCVSGAYRRYRLFFVWCLRRSHHSKNQRVIKQDFSLESMVITAEFRSQESEVRSKIRSISGS